VKRITLLGGEPTIQPAFRELVRYAVELGFDEIVIFSNGSRTGHTDLMDEVLSSGGHFEWRFSFQGGNKAAHERTTGRKGSFDGLIQSLERAAEREQKVTINSCVVKQNYDSLPDFPRLLAPYDVSHVHLDMLHPGDLPDPRKQNLAEIMPRYSDLVEPLRRMLRDFPAEQEVRIGNLPLCIAPDLAAWIHHGGDETWVVGAEQPFDKHENKGAAKTKLRACESCALSSRCGGVYQAYLDVYGEGEIAPVPRDALPPTFSSTTLDPRLSKRLELLTSRAPFGRLGWERIDERANGAELDIHFRSAANEHVELWLKAEPDAVRGGYRIHGDPSDVSPELREALTAILFALGWLKRHDQA
jgi:MoaA/NifB/PqqE/SkfB family radical SAM enzyme